MIFQREAVAETPTALRPVEEALLGDAGGSVFWCGRGATALYAACRLAAAGHKTAEVIVPSLACPSVADAVLAAGAEPRFADVDPETGLATPDSVKARWSRNTRAVVFVHLYGETADLTDLAAGCRRQGALLIEDAAQALGGRGVGEAGDLVVYSFSRTKILECGGGALVIRPCVSAEPEVPHVDSEDLAFIERGDRDLYHGFVSLSRLGVQESLSSFYRSTRPAFVAPLLRPMDDPRPLADAWPTLPAALAARSRKADIAAKHLRGGPWRLLDGWRRSGVCWRLTLLHDAPDVVPALVDAVRADGFAVSTLYWPLSLLYRPEDRCPDAERFARRVVNVLIESHMSEEAVGRCADAVRRHGCGRVEKAEVP